MQKNSKGLLHTCTHKHTHTNTQIDLSILGPLMPMCGEGNDNQSQLPNSNNDIHS